MQQKNQNQKKKKKKKTIANGCLQRNGPIAGKDPSGVKGHANLQPK
jgi:hypothetical protein